METAVEDQVFRTKDLHTAAFFVASGLRISNIERLSGVCYFHFNDREKALSLSRDFLSGTAKVNARALCDAITNLKTAMFSVGV